MSAIALDPLIAEAKQRARRRRWLLAAAGLVAAGAVVATLAVRASERPTPVAVVPPTCRSGQMRLSAPAWGAAAGTLYEPVTLTNTSSATCAVAGWPAVRRFDAAGQAIPVEVSRWVYRLDGAAPFSSVTLAPGKAATFEIFGGDWNPRLDRGCRTATAIAVQPRGGGGWLTASPESAGEDNAGMPACRFWSVGPLVPGHIANPPAYALSIFYSPPTRAHRFYSGVTAGERWQLHVRDSGDGRYCFRVVVDGTAQGGRCGRLFGPGISGKLGWLAKSSGRSFAAGAIVSRAQGVTVHLSNGGVRYLQTMPPNRFLAPGISFFFTTIPAGAHPVEIQGHTRLGRGVVIWKRAY